MEKGKKINKGISTTDAVLNEKARPLPFKKIPKPCEVKEKGAFPSAPLSHSFPISIPFPDRAQRNWLKQSRLDNLSFQPMVLRLAMLQLGPTSFQPPWQFALANRRQRKSRAG